MNRLRRLWSRVLWGPTGPPVPTPERALLPTPEPMPFAHPDQFTSLTPEERASIHAIEKNL